MTEFTFASDSSSHNILFSTWYQDVPPSDIEVLDTVTLENGNEAIITGEFDISWKNDKGYLHEANFGRQS